MDALREKPRVLVTEIKEGGKPVIRKCQVHDGKDRGL